MTATDIPDAPAEGLRERKKALTRTAISDVATRMFVERGFDGVTVAEVAEAAGVSIKTVFNYFGSKEELFLDRDTAIHELVVRTVAGRPAGMRPTEALAALLRDNCILDLPGWEAVEDPGQCEQYRAFLVTWQAAPALRARGLMGDERMLGMMAAALGREGPADRSPDALRAFAAALVSAVQLRQRAIVEAVIAREPAAEVRRRALAAAAEALDGAARGFPALDRPAP